DSYSSGKTYSVMALAHWRSVAHPFPKWPCDSCRVHTADRIAQPRRSRSAVRTLRNRQRVFTQGHLVPRQDFSARRISSFFNLNIFCFLWSFRGFAARIAVSTSDTCATNIGRATSFAKTQRREGAKKFNCISLRLCVFASLRLGCGRRPRWALKDREKFRSPRRARNGLSPCTVKHFSHSLSLEEGIKHATLPFPAARRITQSPAPHAQRSRQRLTRHAQGEDAAQTSGCHSHHRSRVFTGGFWADRFAGQGSSHLYQSG